MQSALGSALLEHGTDVPPNDADERLRTVVLSGDLDMFVASAVRTALDELRGPGIVDMRAVRYLDSSALHELARVANRVGPGNVTLIVSSANVRKVLNIVQFERLFRIVDGAATA